VQPGSIIEYHYMIDFAEYYVFNSNWVLSDDVFTKSAKFTLKPYREWALQWSMPNGLPNGIKPPVNDPKLIHLEVEDVPGFQAEDDMPPEAAMKFRVDFTYSEDGFEMDPAKFWKKQGKKMNDAAEGFVNKRKAMEEAVAEIVSPGDTPDVKLQKIYARVQKVRNTSYEEAKSFGNEDTGTVTKSPGSSWGLCEQLVLKRIRRGLRRATITSSHQTI